MTGERLSAPHATIGGSAEETASTDRAEGLTAAIRRGLAWSTVSTIILRLGTLATGIVLARLLSPQQFGIYAVALTVQAILMTLADLGLSADLIRSKNPARIAPTVATLGLVSGALLTVLMAVTAQQMAGLLNSPGASGVIFLLSFTLLLGGAGIVPYAMLQRRFEQKKLFIIALVDFLLGTAVTLLLLFAGWGVISLAIGRIVAQSSTLVLQFLFARERPHYGFDRGEIGPVLRFGLPIAAANLLSWALLNIDNVVVSRVAGPLALGFYVLAFNVSSWPMSGLGQIVRSISLPAFARTAGSRDDRSLATAISLTWAVALPAGAFLALLSSPLIVFVYGGKWADAAPALAALGVFGALRTVLDLFAAYLTARGATGLVLWIQILWFVVLVPATILGTLWWGIAGTGWSHLVIGLLVVLPVYLYAARRAGADLGAVLRSTWQPVAAMAPAAAVGYFLATRFDAPWLAVVVGGLAGGGVYAAIMYRWIRARISTTRRTS